MSTFVKYVNQNAFGLSTKGAIAIAGSKNCPNLFEELDSDPDDQKLIDHLDAVIR